MLEAREIIMTTYFTSDLHIGHANIIKYCDRPFESVEEMNAALIDRWNSVVGDDDEVYLLGDVFMGRRADFEMLGLLNGHIKLVPGNHDKCWPAHKKVGAEGRAFSFYMDVLQPNPKKPIVFERDGLNVLLHHFPYSGDHGEHDRHVEYRPEDRGQWLLHGHIHEKWKVKDRMINVGVDVWDFYPVEWDVLRSMILEGCASSDSA